MFSNRIRFCTVRSTSKWNLLRIFLLISLALFLTWHKLSFSFQVSNGPVSLQPPVNASLEVYDLGKPVKFDSKCIRTRTTPSTTVCLYPRKIDKYVSAQLEGSGQWESHVADEFQEALRRDSDAGALDIGGNIGYYTMLAASMGRKVVAVEPFSDNIHRIHQAAQIEHLTEKIVLLQNAIADVTASGTLQKSADNQGDTRIKMGVEPCEGSCPPTVKIIRLDDLVGVLPFQKAVMKIDIQGYEHRAFKHASVLFSRINITYVFMEWEVMKDYFNAIKDHAEDVILVENMMNFFLERNYQPYNLSSNGGRPLDPRVWPIWPMDMVWHLMPDKDSKSALPRQLSLFWPS